MSKIGFWIKNARHISLPQSLLPGFLAIGMSLDYGSFSWGLSLVALCGVACAHLGMNLLDDYYDYRQGSGEKRVKLAAGGVRARVAKYPYLTSGQATVGDLVVAISLFLLLAVVAGSVVIYFRGVVPFYITVVGAILGISYSGKPLRLGYYGYGELLIGLMFGPLLMIPSVCGMRCSRRENRFGGYCGRSFGNEYPLFAFGSRCSGRRSNGKAYAGSFVERQKCGFGCFCGIQFCSVPVDYRRGIGRYVAGSLSLRACFVADSGFFVAFASPFCRRTPRRNRS